MTPQQLKASLLQEAIRGKLTDQRPEDGSAEELYRAIIAEKKRLIKAGKLKKEKPLPPIEEKDIPFDIPENWKWVRLGELCRRFSTGPFGSSLHKSDYVKEGGVPIINPTNIKENGIDGTRIERVKQEVVVQLQRFILQIGDLVLARRGNLSKCAIVKEKEEGWLCGTGSFFLSVLGVYNPFLVILYKSSYTQTSLLGKSVGTTMNNLNQSILKLLPIPLPPLAEQERIVAKLEELLPLVERYGKAYTQLTALEQRFPASMRKSLLQEAIQGKLTDQRPEDGSAEDLYRAILAEKKRLIQAGKLKKEKPLLPIEEKDIPFDIPENWKWVRLGELGSFERGSGIKKTETVQEGLPCVRYGQLYTTFRTRFTEAVSFIPRPLFDVCKKAKCGDILMALTGENNFDIALAVAYEGKDSLAIGGDMTRYTPCSIVPMYLVTVLNSGHGISCKSKLATGDIIVHISNDKLATIPIPLPPLAEQERIVAKLEELLPLCD